MFIFLHWYVCYDEADQLFELGFAPQLNDICRQLPANRQSMLISATLPAMLLEFSRAGLHDAEMVRLDTDSKLSPNLCNSFFIMRQVCSLIWIDMNWIELEWNDMKWLVAGWLAGEEGRKEKEKRDDIRRRADD